MTANTLRLKAIFKICPRSAWDAAMRDGTFVGSVDDRRDGYIHFSTADQIAGTAAKYFKGLSDLVVVAVDPSRLGAALRWEASRGGQLFPHLYAPLDTAATLWVRPAPFGADGVPILPKEVYPC